MISSSNTYYFTQEIDQKFQNKQENSIFDVFNRHVLRKNDIRNCLKSIS